MFTVNRRAPNVGSRQNRRQKKQNCFCRIAIIVLMPQAPISITSKNKSIIKRQNYIRILCHLLKLVSIVDQLVPILAPYGLQSRGEYRDQNVIFEMFSNFS